MAEGVTYADLRFVRNPPGNKTPREGNEAEEGELTYENVQGSRPGGKEETPSTPQEDTGSKPWLKGAALAVLTACIILLAAAVGLGVRYWQVSGQLQRASQKHEAHSSALAQRLDLQEGNLTQKEDRLRQAMTELSSTREMLRKSQEASGRTQEQLKEVNHSLETMRWEKDQTEAELQQATEKLASAQEALRASQGSTEKTQERLQETERSLREANLSLETMKQEKVQMGANLQKAIVCRRKDVLVARFPSGISAKHAALAFPRAAVTLCVCMDTHLHAWTWILTISEISKPCAEEDCCPDGWTLFLWKCIWVSQVTRTWQQSWEACARKSSQLLMPKERWEQWETRHALDPQRSNGYWIGLRRIREKQKWIDVWVDESEGSERFMQNQNSNCMRVKQGQLVWYRCSSFGYYICERAANLTNLQQAPGPI